VRGLAAAPLADTQARAIGQALLGRAGATLPSAPRDYARAVFQHWTNNSDIARVLTDAPRGSTAWKSAMQSVRRWRASLLEGRGARRDPSAGSIERLRHPALRNPVAIEGLRGGVMLRGQVELVYGPTGVSQGIRQLGERSRDETVSAERVRALYAESRGDVVELGQRILQEAVDQYIGAPGQYYAGSQTGPLLVLPM